MDHPAVNEPVNYGAVLAVLLGSIATLLPSTTINVAIPNIQGALGIDDVKAQLLSSAFLAATTTGMLANAWLVESFGPKKVLVSCIVLFVFASIWGGLTSSINLLVLCRALQGLASGPVMPLAMLVMYTSFPESKRGLAMGLFGSGVVLAPAFGPALGGYLIDVFDWRYVMLGMAPVALVSLPFAISSLSDRLPNTHAMPRKKLDWLGILLLNLCVLSMMSLFSRGPREGWNDNYNELTMLILATSVIAFFWWELRCKHPLIDLRLLLSTNFFIATMVAFLSGTALYASTYLLPLFVQKIIGASPLESGKLFIPAGIAMALFFPFAGMLTDKFNVKYVLLIGSIVLALTTIPFATINIGTSFFSIIVLTLIGRIGLAMMMPSMTKIAMTSVKMADSPQASSITNFARQMGGVIGIGFVTLTLSSSTYELNALFQSFITTENPMLGQALNESGMIMQESGMNNFERYMGSYGSVYSVAQEQATIGAFGIGFKLLAIFSFITILFVFPLKQSKTKIQT